DAIGSNSRSQRADNLFDGAAAAVDISLIQTIRCSEYALILHMHARAADFQIGQLIEGMADQRMRSLAQPTRSRTSSIPTRRPRCAPFGEPPPNARAPG